MKQNKIRCILTGGTIDNQYHQRLGKMVVHKNVERMLSKLRLPHHEIITERLFKLDSRDLKDSHRERILSSVVRSPQNHIVITHGTDTLVKTAQHLSRSLKNLKAKNQKTIVFTGAMEPYGLETSQPSGKKGDALQNLISSISLVEILPVGVWIVFHGRVFKPSKAYKDYQALTFFER